MKLDIPYHQLRFVEYEGAGNRTPVLDISSIAGIDTLPIQDVKASLELDITFRRYLQKIGTNVHADSVMIFYRSKSVASPYVTFIGEPGADISSSFSDMCGNGIRALALHIMLNEPSIYRKNQYLNEGISIFAGEVRTIQIEDISIQHSAGSFSVDLGPYQTDIQNVESFINVDAFPHIQSFSQIPFNGQAPDLHGLTFNIGFNGTTIGEPHLTIFVTKDISVPDEIVTFLREVACKIGNRLTFDSWLFPKGINVNIAMVYEGRVFLSTHERNLSVNSEECLARRNHTYCRCNTLACGTGGAAVANVAVRNGLLPGNTVITVHPGGCIKYEVSSTTIMTGPAKKL